MVVFSTLRSQLRLVNVLGRKSYIPDSVIKRYAGGGHNIKIQMSEYRHKKFFDLFSFYTCIAAIFYGSIIIYANVFVGKPILIETPEGYRPQYWEYYSHPITRAIQRYLATDPQMEYEKNLHEMYEEDERKKMTDLDRKVKEMMKQRKDYQAYYYRPLTSFADYIKHDHYEESRREIMEGLVAGDMSMPFGFDESPEGGQVEETLPSQFTYDGTYADNMVAEFRSYNDK